MSCDWDIHCVDCRADANIENANHEMELMRFLCSTAEKLAEMASPSAQDHGLRWLEYEVKINCHYIPLDFFLKHRGHHLRPRNEYGEFDTPCQTTFHCPVCDKIVNCSKLEHPEDRGHYHVVDHQCHQSPRP